jgi:hypothetical protein
LGNVVGLCSTNDPSVVKRSVGSNMGMLSAQYRWIRRPAPFSTTKGDATMNLNTQSQYIENRTKRALAVYNQLNAENYVDGSYTKGGNSANAGNGRVGKPTTLCGFVSKPDNVMFADTQSNYIRGLQTECSALDTFTVPNPNLCGRAFV